MFSAVMMFLWLTEYHWLSMCVYTWFPPKPPCTDKGLVKTNQPLSVRKCWKAAAMETVIIAESIGRNWSYSVLQKMEIIFCEGNRTVKLSEHFLNRRHQLSVWINLFRCFQFWIMYSPGPCSVSAISMPIWLQSCPFYFLKKMNYSQQTSMLVVAVLLFRT